MTLSENTNQKQMSNKWLTTFIGLFCLAFLNYFLALRSLSPPQENVATVFWPTIIYDKLLKPSLFALLASWVLIIAYPIYHHRWGESAIIFVTTITVSCSFLWISTIFPTLSIIDTAKINGQSYYLIEVDEPWEFWTYLGFRVEEAIGVSCDYFLTFYKPQPEYPKFATGSDGTVQVQWNDQILYRYNGRLPGQCNQQFDSSFGHCSSSAPRSR